PLRVLGAGRGEGDRAVLVAGDVAVALQAAHHLVHRGRRELHRAGDVGAGHRQARLLQPEQALQILLLGDRRGVLSHVRDARGRPAARCPLANGPVAALSAEELIEGALARGLVLAPAAQARAVADAPRRDVIEVDLHDQLRAQRDPLQLAPGAPAAGVAAAALAGLEGFEKAHQTALLGSAQARAVSHHAQLGLGRAALALALLVQAENERAHRLW